MSKGGPRYYTGSPPSRCDLCDRRLLFLMYDAFVPLYGTWGNICGHCFDLHSCQLGTGKGAKYELQEDGRWMKMAGRIVLPMLLVLLVAACLAFVLLRERPADPAGGSPAEAAARAAEAVAKAVRRAY